MTLSCTALIGRERRANPVLTQDEQTYVDELLAGLGPGPAYYAHMAPANAGGPSEPDLTLPIEHAGETIGDLAVTKSSGDPLRPTERTLLEDLAAHAGIGLENARLSVDLARRAEELSAQTGELRRSRERLVTVRDAQRRRLEQELRDGVGAEIAAIRDEIRDDASRVIAEPDGVRDSLERLSARTTVALNDLREVARGIFPPLLSDKGLAAALGALARRAGNETQLSILGGTPDTRYDATVEAAIYF